MREFGGLSACERREPMVPLGAPGAACTKRRKEAVV